MMIHAAQAASDGLGHGKWFGPILMFAASFLLDYSAIGSNAFRDRIAAAGYYAATAGLIAIYKWEGVIQGWFSADSDWKLAGSAIAALLHIGLVLAMIGDKLKGTAQISKKIHSLIGLNSKDSGENKINMTLLRWSIFAAASSVLARGPIGGFVVWVGGLLTGIWTWIASAITNGIGG
jgi:hypothetical protein